MSYYFPSCAPQATPTNKKPDLSFLIKQDVTCRRNEKCLQLIRAEVAAHPPGRATT